MTSAGIVEALGWELERTPWMARAGCRHSDPDLFFPDRGESCAEARAICQTCPVSDDCLAYALRWNIRDGVWGGLTARERRRFDRPQRVRRCVLCSRRLTSSNAQRFYCSRSCRQRAYVARRTLFESDHARVCEIHPKAEFL